MNIQERYNRLTSKQKAQFSRLRRPSMETGWKKLTDEEILNMIERDAKPKVDNSKFARIANRPRVLRKGWKTIVKEERGDYTVFCKGIEYSTQTEWWPFITGKDRTRMEMLKELKRAFREVRNPYPWTVFGNEYLGKAYVLYYGDAERRNLTPVYEYQIVKTGMEPDDSIPNKIKFHPIYGRKESHGRRETDPSDYITSEEVKRKLDGE
jgi:hypothetical protein|tara:strand:- start:819 stop:1445 length:627 start_codon:yes stop_codon:yes gene_type:complete